MTRPHPVVRLSTELTDAGRRSSHHAYIWIHFIIDKVEAVTSIERIHLSANTRLAIQFALSHQSLCQFIQIRSSHRIHLGSLSTLDVLVHHISHIDDAVYETEAQSLVWQLIFQSHGPETICQIVVLHGTMTLNSTVATVMIGKYQTVGRDNLTSAATAKDTHCIFQ